MIIKIFSQGQNSGTEHINYLLSEEKHIGCKPKVMKGNAFITEMITNSITNKNKYVSGVLSFDNGQYIDEAKQLQMIDMFESFVAPFENKERVNFLWVKHEDKGRLELHFITPRIDLESGKAFNIHPEIKSALGNPNKKTDSNVLFYKHITAIFNHMNGFNQVSKKGTISKPYTESNFNFSLKLTKDLKEKRAIYIKNQYCEKKKTIYNKKTTKAKRLTNGMETNNRGQNANTLHDNRANTKNSVQPPRDIKPIVKREEFRESATDKQNTSTSTKQYVKPTKQVQSKSDNRSSTDKAQNIASSPLIFQLQEITALYNNEHDIFKRLELYNRLLSIRYQLEIEENAKKLQVEKSNKLKP